MSHVKPALLATTLLALLTVPAFADVPAGVAAAVNPQATSTPPSAPTRVLEVGSNLVMNEKVQTSEAGQTQLLFRDGSTVTVGPGADLVIDSFVYDPDKRTAKLAMTAASGLIRFVGGRASKEEGGVTVTTPSATIGIRGGIADIGHDPQTNTTTANFLFGQSLQVNTPTSSQFLNTPGFGFTIGKDGSISPPFPITPQTLVLINKQIEGKGGKPGGGNGAPSSPDNNAGGVSNANSNAPPPPPPLANTFAGITQSNTIQTVTQKITNDTAGNTLDSSSTTAGSFGTTGSPSLKSGTYNVAAIVPQTNSSPTILSPTDGETYPTFTYNSDGTTATQTSTIKLGFDNNQIKTYDQTASFGFSYPNYPTQTIDQTTHADFNAVLIQDYVVDGGVALGAWVGGTITAHDTSGTTVYALLKTDRLPFAIGSPIDPAMMPTNTYWLYNFTGATPVYFSDGSAVGTIASDKLAVYFGGPASANYNNIAASWNFTVTIGGHTYAGSTTVGSSQSALMASLASGGNGALTGSTGRGDLSGTFNLVSTNGGSFCSTTCQGQANGFFSGAKGTQVALVYQAPYQYRLTAPIGSQGVLTVGNTLNLMGAVSFTHH